MQFRWHMATARANGFGAHSPARMRVTSLAGAEYSPENTTACSAWSLALSEAAPILLYRQADAFVDNVPRRQIVSLCPVLVLVPPSVHAIARSPPYRPGRLVPDGCLPQGARRDLARNRRSDSQHLDARRQQRLAVRGAIQQFSRHADRAALFPDGKSHLRLGGRPVRVSRRGVHDRRHVHRPGWE